MNLRKQLFTSFCSVAIVPLAVVTLYMLASNVMLAFNLYEQNLQNSTEIQSDLLDENVNQLMARATKFTTLGAVQDACKTSNELLLVSQNLSKDILNFTDETVDNVAAFALTDEKGKILYFSGSNTDRSSLEAVITTTEMDQNQKIYEIPFGGSHNNLMINTPVKSGSSTVGKLLVVCRTDYFLKIISTHKQVESSNAMIYCTEHEQVVTYKQPLENNQFKLEKMEKSKLQGSILCSIDNKRVMAYYRNVAKTSWVLVNTIPTGQIFSRVWNYGLVNAIAIFLAMLAIVLLSRRQSKKILYPLEELLNAVEGFFLTDTTQFPLTDINPHTEIGYLAGKFAGMSKDMATTQGKLRESNYLYAALMRATYEFRMVIDLEENSIECTDGEISERLNYMEGKTVSERVMNLWKEYSIGDEATDETFENIAYGRLQEPTEAEICYNLLEQKELWYRIIAVPIVGSDGSVSRVVIHFEDITARKHREIGLIHSSQVDPLCGLFNKSAFHLYCKQSGQGKTDAVFFIDLDKFKQVNDMLGHVAGDEVLVATAKAIRNEFRDTDIIGRFGGDEFVVFAPNMSIAQVEQKAEALVRALVFHRCSSQGVEIHVSASIGICLATNDMNLNDAIEIADEAMYYAKEHGKAQYHVAAQNDLTKGEE